MSEFDKFGLRSSLNAGLELAKISKPTPIQEQAIPLALAGHDIMGLAQTGTGKTLAFGLPLLDHLLKLPGKPDPKTARALILAPTRELVNQIAENLRKLIQKTHLRVVIVVGGQSINRQISHMERGTDILVATPGRLIDLMDREAINLGAVKHLVLDEADQMLDMGFIHALRRIEPELGTPRHTMLFSATMPKQMEALANSYLTEPKRVQVAAPGKTADKIDQSVHFLARVEKPRKLREILSADPNKRTLVFARTKHGAEKMMKQLVADGFDAVSIHGNKSQGQRERAISAFKDGSVKILVATDVAARGIDIPDVGYVINFDLPEVAANYVHRIGRTARAGRDGQAITLCCAEEVNLLLQIQKLIKLTIPVASGRMPEPVDAPPTRRRRGGGHGGGHGAGQGRGGSKGAGSSKPRGSKAGGSKAGGPKSGPRGGKPKGPKPSGAPKGRRPRRGR